MTQFLLGPDDVEWEQLPRAVAYQTREENRVQGPSLRTAPDSQFQKLLPENIGWQEAPDPIRQSDFWADGNKIKPDARQRVTSHLSIDSFANWENSTFEIGKLIGYLRVPMHQGGQLPSVIRANIQEAQPITYGSLYEVSPPPTQSGPAYTSTGFTVSGLDGYPY
jgi:hypothetical protein